MVSWGLCQAAAQDRRVGAQGAWAPGRRSGHTQARARLGGETAEGCLASCVLERACRGLAPAELPYPLTWCQPCSLLPCLVTWVTPDHADSESPRGWVSAALRSVGAGRVARSLGLLC